MGYVDLLELSTLFHLSKDPNTGMMTTTLMLVSTMTRGLARLLAAARVSTCHKARIPTSRDRLELAPNSPRACPTIREPCVEFDVCVLRSRPNAKTKSLLWMVAMVRRLLAARCCAWPTSSSRRSRDRCTDLQSTGPPRPVSTVVVDRHANVRRLYAVATSCASVAAIASDRRLVLVSSR